MDLLAPNFGGPIVQTLLVALAAEFCPPLTLVVVQEVGRHDCSATLRSSARWTEDDSLRLAFKIEHDSRFRERFGSVRIIPRGGRTICTIWTVTLLPRLMLYL